MHGVYTIFEKLSKAKISSKLQCTSHR